MEKRSWDWDRMGTQWIGGEMQMKNEDAIRWLENLKQDISQLRHEELWPYAQVIEEIISMLKKQEPKQVIDMIDFFEGMKTGKCPSCARSLVNLDIDESRFCKYCGQAVKWNE